MVADYRIVELIPNFLIVLCGMYASIFLPKISAMMSHADMQAVQDYANVWTLRTSVLACMIGGAIFLCAPELMYAYLGSEEDTLAYWLALWIPAIILQIHTTPGNAIVLAHGRTMPLILTTLVACMLSIPVNVVCLERFGVGAAVVSYYVYILIVVVLLYVYYYDHVVRIKGGEIFQRFFLPTVGAMVSLLLCNLLFELFHPWMGFHNRWESVGLIVVKTATWVAVYFFVLKSIKIRNAFNTNYIVPILIDSRKTMLCLFMEFFLSCLRMLFKILATLLNNVEFSIQRPVNTPYLDIVTDSSICNAIFLSVFFNCQGWVVLYLAYSHLTDTKSLIPHS
jgi:hypothetical protein